jgi:anaerobic selenocysteine-containing dehydrogenase
VGASTQEFGTLTHWLIYALNILTGNLDRPGGAMFTRPAFDLMKLPGVNRGDFGRWRSRVRHLPEFGGELPAAVMAEEMLTPGEGQIRAMLTVAGNPALSSPNGRQLEKGLAQLEFMVSIDFYLNETTRHADIILPPSDALEHGNYDVIFNLLAIRNTAHYSPALFKPGEGTRHDWEILLELHTRLLSSGPFSRARGRLRRAILHRVGPEGLIDLGLRMGPYASGWRIWKRGLSLRKVKEAVHGIDLGPLEPCLPGRLNTPSKRIQLAPAPLRADMERLRARFSLYNGTALATIAPRSPEEDAQENVSDLVLIGRRNLRSNNSWMGNSERLVKGEDRCALLIHPEDAQRRGVADGQQARVTSRVGSITAVVELSLEMMPGVVSLPHGWGHTREGAQLKVAQLHPGVSVNDITDEVAIDALSGTAAFNGIPVMVEPFAPATNDEHKGQ